MKSNLCIRRRGSVIEKDVRTTYREDSFYSGRSNKMKQEEVSLQKIKKEDIHSLWEISYGPAADLEWTKWNGPYFNDPILTWEEYKNGFGKDSVDNEMRRSILLGEKQVGMVTAYWEDGSLRRWLEVGIVIYDSSLWKKGIGRRALKQWLTILFDQEKELEHIGFTTWSGNQRMMKLGEQVGMKEEGRIRKVRFWENKFYDSMKYGVIRKEWKENLS